MSNIEKAIEWMYSKQGKVFYSQHYRLGQVITGKQGYDCSSSVYFAMIAGGFFTTGKMGNTDSLFGDLEKIGWKKVPLNSKGYYDCKRGDIFIWGIRGASGGNFGHTGFIVDDKDTIINMRPTGMMVDNHDWLYDMNQPPDNTIYRMPTAQQNSDIKVGDTVTLLNHATHWQTTERILPTVKGKRYEVIQIKPVKQSNSSKAYLLKGVNSWALAQDVSK